MVCSGKFGIILIQFWPLAHNLLEIGLGGIGNRRFFNTWAILNNFCHISRRIRQYTMNRYYNDDMCCIMRCKRRTIRNIIEIYLDKQKQNMLTEFGG